MHYFRQLFDNTPWLNFIFLLLSVISIILAFYFYKKAQREKRPVFARRTTRLVQPYLSSLKSLNIQYQGQDVKTLSLTKFSFWNAGKDPIRKEDIAPGDPLFIQASTNIIFYDVEIDYQ